MTRATLSTPPPPPVPSATTEHTALDLSTGAGTLGEMLLRCEGRAGVALATRRAGPGGTPPTRSCSARPATSPEDSSRSAWSPASASRSSPTLARSGQLPTPRLLRRRRRRTDLPHQLARGVRVRARALRGQGGVLRGRRADGQDRADPGRLPATERRDRASTAPARGGAHARSAHRPRPGDSRERSRRACGRRLTGGHGDAWSTRRGRPARRRRAC